jgi:Uma2 family endonuclease
MTARESIDLELMQAPLDGERLSRRWREMLEDRNLANVQGKVELDQWGRIIVMSPVKPPHGNAAGQLTYLLKSQLGGRVLPEVGVLTAIGVLAPDVTWCSEAFWQAHKEEAPFQTAPEICVEVASPDNTLAELRGKCKAYLQAGAREAWIVYPRTKRVEVHAPSGEIQQSSFQVDLSTLFD